METRDTGIQRRREKGRDVGRKGEAYRGGEEGQIWSWVLPHDPPSLHPHKHTTSTLAFTCHFFFLSLSSLVISTSPYRFRLPSQYFPLASTSVHIVFNEFPSTLVRIFELLVLLLRGQKTCIPSYGFEKHTDAHLIKFLHRLMEYRWEDLVSSEQLLDETESRCICTFRDM